MAKDKAFAAYNILPTGRLVILLAVCCVLYGLFMWRGAAFIADLLPMHVVAALKFGAFLLAAYSTLQHYGREEHRQRMLADATPGNATEDKRQYALEQLKRLSVDDKRGRNMAVCAFCILALLAGFGHV